MVKSHPTWVRGLKPEWAVRRHDLLRVAPYVGAWIETRVSIFFRSCKHVAPYVGAWIETILVTGEPTKIVSHPTWVRGLKHPNGCRRWSNDHVAPYVGAWIETSLYVNVRNTAHVAPYVGAWIETG